MEDGASHVNIVAFAWMVEWLLSRAKKRAREEAAWRQTKTSGEEKARRKSKQVAFMILSSLASRFPSLCPTNQPFESEAARGPWL